jgi:hypothetical protein
MSLQELIEDWPAAQDLVDRLKFRASGQDIAHKAKVSPQVTSGTWNAPILRVAGLFEMSAERVPGHLSSNASCSSQGPDATMATAAARGGVRGTPPRPPAHARDPRATPPAWEYGSGRMTPSRAARPGMSPLPSLEEQVTDSAAQEHSAAGSRDGGRDSFAHASASSVGGQPGGAGAAL